jgi:hypothetical protein
MNETLDMERVQRSVIRRVKGGATTMEVMHWLRKKFGIEGAEAQAMLKVAARARNRVVRKQAALGILLCLIFFVVSVGAVILVLSVGKLIGSIYYVISAGISGVFLVRYIVRFFKAGEEAAAGFKV